MKLVFITTMKSSKEQITSSSYYSQDPKTKTKKTLCPYMFVNAVTKKDFSVIFLQMSKEEK